MPDESEEERGVTLQQLSIITNKSLLLFTEVRGPEIDDRSEAK